MSGHVAPVAPSRYAYIHYRCRCDDCRLANREYQREATARRSYLLDQGLEAVVHGKRSTYINWGCRCEPCTTANTVACADYDARRKAEAAPP